MRSSMVMAATAVLSVVSGHNLINNAVGDQGGKALAFGVSAATSNSQSDTTTFKAGTKFGATQKGAVDPAAQLAAVQKIAGNTLPQVASQITLTLHQINGDGAGPMACSIDTAAAGTFAVSATVATDVPGNNGNSGASNQDFPLVVNVAAGTVCTGVLGAVKNVCLVKCQNPAGPFGGVVPFQIAAAGAAGAAGGAAAAANDTGAAAAGAAAGAAKKGAANANADGAKGNKAGGKKQGRWVAVDF